LESNNSISKFLNSMAIKYLTFVLIFINTSAQAYTYNFAPLDLIFRTNIIAINGERLGSIVNGVNLKILSGQIIHDSRTGTSLDLAFEMTQDIAFSDEVKFVNGGRGRIVGRGANRIGKVPTNGDIVDAASYRIDVIFDDQKIETWNLRLQPSQFLTMNMNEETRQYLVDSNLIAGRGDYTSSHYRNLGNDIYSVSNGDFVPTTSYATARFYPDNAFFVGTLKLTNQNNVPVLEPLTGSLLSLSLAYYARKKRSQSKIKLS
jgi:hypothetical protein